MTSFEYIHLWSVAYYEYSITSDASSDGQKANWGMGMDDEKYIHTFELTLRR
jgi:hypothetical protein